MVVVVQHGPGRNAGGGCARSAESPPGADVWRLWVGGAVVGLLFAIDVDTVGPVERFARTETHWWQRYVMRAAEGRFVTGRLTFVDFSKLAEERKGAPAPAPSAVIVFRPGKHVTKIDEYEKAVQVEDRAKS